MNSEAARPGWKHGRRLKLIVILMVALLSYYAARHTVDFPIYHAMARAMLAGNGPLYGPNSGVGWPLVYRYPPLFLLLFVPFALLPLKLGAVIWTALKFVALYYLARALLARLQLSSPIGVQFLALIPAVPYLALEFHYGNAQFFIFAMVAAALLCMQKRPIQAALILALGISLKVWPLFFLPYLMARRYRHVVALTLAFTVGLTLIPVGYWGWHGNAALLRQWATQEYGIAATGGEADIPGFPSQSLRSVMMRYLVSLDYSKLYDPNYPKFNLTAVNPHTVELLWAILAASAYAALLLFAWRGRESEELTLHGLAFCGLVLLQPFTKNTDLVVLLWPITVGVAALHGDKMLQRWARGALYIAMSLMVLKPFLPTSAMHRILQVLGADFWETCLLGAGLIGRCVKRCGEGRSPKGTSGSSFRAGTIPGVN